MWDVKVVLGQLQAGCEKGDYDYYSSVSEDLWTVPCVPHILYSSRIWRTEGEERFRSVCEVEVALPVWGGGDGFCQHSLVRNGCFQLREEISHWDVCEQEEQLMDS